MGNTGGSERSENSSSSRRWKRSRRRHSHVGMSLEDFKCPKGFMSNIGVGGFGKVLAMVKKDEPHRRFAIKCLHKGKVLHKDQVDNCMNELDILRRLDHYAYLVNLFYAFQDKHHLYMCTDLMLGGTLQRALKKAPGGTFADHPERICQYAAELTLALQFLHSQNVVHRDIKPDNILLDAKGHCHLTDFNVSIYIPPGEEESRKHEDGWGTRGYRAPEVYLRTGRGFIFACDWWSLGAVLFELFTGQVPYPKLSSDESSTDLLMRMNAECADFARIKPELARDFIRKLLRFDPELRIGCQHGCNSEVMIMTHPYFEGMDWDELERYNTCNDVEPSRTATTADASECSSTMASSTQDDGDSVHGIKEFAENFDPSLDQREKLRILQRNMGILGFSGADGFDDDDEEDYPKLTEAQQALFKDWAYNVDFKLEQQKRPQFTLLQTVSSMAPEQIKSWIERSTSDSLKALCSEMKSYREQAMKENFDHVMAEMKIEQLNDEVLRLTRKVGELESELKRVKEVQPVERSSEKVPAKMSKDSDSDQGTRKQLLVQKKSSVAGNGASDEEEIVLFSPSQMSNKSSSFGARSSRFSLLSERSNAPIAQLDDDDRSSTPRRSPSEMNNGQVQLANATLDEDEDSDFQNSDAFEDDEENNSFKLTKLS